MAHSGRTSDALGLDSSLRDILPTRVPVSEFFFDLVLSASTSGRRHLLGLGKETDARRIIAHLNSVPEDDPVVIETLEELEFAVRAENEGGKATWLECFSTRNMLWKRTINGMMLQFIQQLNGQNFYCGHSLWDMFSEVSEHPVHA